MNPTEIIHNYTYIINTFLKVLFLLLPTNSEVDVIVNQEGKLCLSDDSGTISNYLRRVSVYLYDKFQLAIHIEISEYGDNFIDDGDRPIYRKVLLIPDCEKDNMEALINVLTDDILTSCESHNVYIAMQKKGR